MTRPRVLIISTRFPFPVIGGDRLRIVSIARELSEHADVDLLCLRAAGAPEVKDTSPFAKITTVPFSLFRGVLRLVPALFSGTPFQVALYGEREMYRQAKQVAGQYDAVLVHLVRAAQFVMNRSGERDFLEMTDAISLNYARTCQLPSVSWAKRILYRMEGAQIGRCEDKMVRHFRNTFLVSATDRNYLATRNPELDHKLIVAQNGVNLNDLPRVQATASPVVGFVGSMGYLPNIDACRYFVEEILAPLRAAIPGLVFRIVGRGPASVLESLARHEGVEVTGEVESVARAMEGCYAAVAPIRIAAGLQNKVLEYMAMGIATVVTPICAGPIGAKAGEQLLIADDDRSFCEALTHLWHDSAFRAQLSQAGHDYVKSEFSWAGRLAPLVQSIKAVL